MLTGHELVVLAIQTRAAREEQETAEWERIWDEADDKPRPWDRVIGIRNGEIIYAEDPDEYE